MDDKLKEYLMSKMNQANPEYIAAEDEMKQRQSDLGLSQLAAGIGDALARRSSAATDDYFNNRRNQIKDETIGEFNRKKANAIAEESLRREQNNYDPNSQESKNFRSLVESTMPNIAKAYGQHWDKVSASDQKNILDFGKMRETLDARKEYQQEKMEQLKNKEVSLKQNQAAALGFGKRVEQANNIFDELSANGYNRSDISSGIGALLPNVWKSNNAQKQDQAERNFVNAVLRRESGAAISPSEFQSAEKQYFPRAGDSAEVVEQKRMNRLQSLESLKAEAGKAYDQIPLMSKQNNHNPTSNKFPMTIRKDGQVASVSNEEELKEAKSEGWK